MPLNDAALVLAANAIQAAITHLSLHSADPGAGGANEVGTRVAAAGAVDADGDITWSNVAFTGLTANQPVSHVGYWSASTGGTFYGSRALTGDTTASSSGGYTITSLAENSTVS